MNNGTQAFRVAAMAGAAVGLVAALSWFSIGSFEVDLAVIIIACLLAGYVAGERRAR